MPSLIRVFIKLASAAFVVMLVLLPVAVFSEAHKSETSSEISQRIEAIKAERSPMIRYQRAHELFDSAKRVGAQNVTNSEIVAITELLKTPDDPARYWVAVTLGYMGPRAASAVPVLESALRQEACTMASKTSAHVIRSALEEIGVTPPLVSCPIVANGYLNEVSITLFNKGHGVTFKNVPPGRCIEINPEDFVLTKLIVVPERLLAKTYSTNEFRNAVEKARQKNGLFVVNEAGLSYVKEYKCVFPH